MNHLKIVHNSVEHCIPFSHSTKCGHHRAGNHIYFQCNSSSIEKVRHLGCWIMHVLCYSNTPWHVETIINTYGVCYFLIVAILQ